MRLVRILVALLVVGAGCVNFLAGTLYLIGGGWSLSMEAVAEDEETSEDTEESVSRWRALGTTYGAFGAFLLFVSMLQLSAGSFLPFGSAQRPVIFLMILATGVLGIVAELLGWYVHDLGPFGWYCLASSLLLIPVSMQTFGSA